MKHGRVAQGAFAAIVLAVLTVAVAARAVSLLGDHNGPKFQGSGVGYKFWASPPAYRGVAIDKFGPDSSNHTGPWVFFPVNQLAPLDPSTYAYASGTRSFWVKAPAPAQTPDPFRYEVGMAPGPTVGIHTQAWFVTDQRDSGLGPGVDSPNGKCGGGGGDENECTGAACEAGPTFQPTFWHYRVANSTQQPVKMPAYQRSPYCLNGSDCGGGDPPNALPENFLPWAEAPRLSDLESLTLTVTSQVLSWSTGSRCSLQGRSNFPTVIYGLVFETDAGANGRDGQPNNGSNPQKLFYQITVFDPRADGPAPGPNATGVPFYMAIVGDDQGHRLGENIGATINAHSGGAVIEDPRNWPIRNAFGVSDWISLWGEPELHGNANPISVPTSVPIAGAERTYQIDVLPRVKWHLQQNPLRPRPREPGASPILEPDLARWRPKDMYISSAVHGQATIKARHRGISLVGR